jgi:glutathione S-transferase
MEHDRAASMTKPILYVFAISHYCEKARWALEYLDIDFEIGHVAPGLHISLAKKLGASRSSVPILVADGQVVQGSAEIIDWADAAASAGSKCLTPDSAREECVALERRLDDVVGVHIRRYYYSEALVDHPRTVKPIFIKDLGIRQRLMISATWGLVRKLMIKGMDLGPEQGQESKRIVEAELDWLDGLLADGRQFLTGDQLSRADIAAASLLAPLAAPIEHPTYGNLVVPPHVAEDLVSWKNRRTVSWIREIYRRYR